MSSRDRACTGHGSLATRSQVINTAGFTQWLYIPWAQEIRLGSPDRFPCEGCGLGARLGLLPDFRTASDKSWAWRPGNEATENQLLMRHFRGSPAFPSLGFPRVQSTLRSLNPDVTPALLIPERELSSTACGTAALLHHNARTRRQCERLIPLKRQTLDDRYLLLWTVANRTRSSLCRGDNL